MKQLLVFALLGVSMVMAATKEVTIINKILSNIIICQLDSDLIHVDILNRMTMTITQVELMAGGRMSLSWEFKEERLHFTLVIYVYESC